MVKRNYMVRIVREVLIENVESPKAAFAEAENAGEECWGVEEYSAECQTCDENYEKYEATDEHDCEVKD